MNPRTIALIDGNNFYVSCHCLDHPWLREQAVIVLSNNDANIIARSDAAKKLGVKMADPIFTWQHAIDVGDLIAISADFSLYADMSRRFYKVLREFGRVERYSIDECFVELDHPDDLEEQAVRIRERVYRQIGMPVAVGIAPTKVLAKLANRLAKKQNAGTYILMEEEQRQLVLAETKVGNVWGIGRQYTARLAELGVMTALHLTEMLNTRIRNHFNVEVLRKVEELRGKTIYTLSERSPLPKSASRSKNLAMPASTYQDVLQTLLYYLKQACEFLQEVQLVPTRLEIVIATRPRRSGQRIAQQFRLRSLLEEQTNDYQRLGHILKWMLDHIYVPEEYRFVSVQLLGLKSAAYCQLSWLEMLHMDDLSTYEHLEGLPRWQKPPRYPMHLLKKPITTE